MRFGGKYGVARAYLTKNSQKILKLLEFSDGDGYEFNDICSILNIQKPAVYENLGRLKDINLVDCRIHNDTQKLWYFVEDAKKDGVLFYKIMDARNGVKNVQKTLNNIVIKDDGDNKTIVSITKNSRSVLTLLETNDGGLSEKELCFNLDMSRTSVRDSLRRLKEHDLVRFDDNTKRWGCAAMKENKSKTLRDEIISLLKDNGRECTLSFLVSNCKLGKRTSVVFCLSKLVSESVVERTNRGRYKINTKKNKVKISENQKNDNVEQSTYSKEAINEDPNSATKRRSPKRNQKESETDKKANIKLGSTEHNSRDGSSDQAHFGGCSDENRACFETNDVSLELAKHMVEAQVTPLSSPERRACWSNWALARLGDQGSQQSEPHLRRSNSTEIPTSNMLNESKQKLLDKNEVLVAIDRKIVHMIVSENRTIEAKSYMIGELLRDDNQLIYSINLPDNEKLEVANLLLNDQLSNCFCFLSRLKKWLDI